MCTYTYVASRFLYQNQSLRQFTRKSLRLDHRIIYKIRLDQCYGILAVDDVTYFEEIRGSISEIATTLNNGDERDRENR